MSQQYSPVEITEWVQWFCATYGGPVFYEMPIPQDGIWDPKVLGYQVCLFCFVFVYTQVELFQKPHGFLKSEFTIDVGTHFLQEIKDSAFDFGPPQGLFVLILTAVSLLYSVHSYFLMMSMQYEKVSQSYKTGVYMPTADFCAKFCNTWVRQYNKNFNKKDDDWWSDLLEHYDVAGDGQVGQVDMLMLDEGRAVMPMSSL